MPHIWYAIKISHVTYFICHHLTILNYTTIRITHNSQGTLLILQNNLLLFFFFLFLNIQSFFLFVRLFSLGENNNNNNVDVMQQLSLSFYIYYTIFFLLQNVAEKIKNLWLIYKSRGKKTKSLIKCFSTESRMSDVFRAEMGSKETRKPNNCVVLSVVLINANTRWTVCCVCE